MSFNIRRFEGCFEGVSQKYFKNFFLAPSMDSLMDLISLPSLRAISRRDTPSASISSLRRCTSESCPNASLIRWFSSYRKSSVSGVLPSA